MIPKPGSEGQTTGRGTLVEERFWRPHANPRSVWGFVATYPLFVVAVYRRSRRLFAATLLSVVVNLLTASPPETDDAWATRVVLGERVWLAVGVSSRRDALGVTAVGAAVQVYTLRAAANRRPGRTAVGAVASMLLMLLFFDRMVRLYGEYDHDTAARRGDVPTG